MIADEKGGPADHGAASDASNLDTSSITRCTVCSHPLTAARSIELEMGPVCRVNAA